MSEDGGASVRVLFMDGGSILGLFEDFFVEHERAVGEFVARDVERLRT